MVVRVLKVIAGEVRLAAELHAARIAHTDHHRAVRQIKFHHRVHEVLDSATNT